MRNFMHEPGFEPQLYALRASVTLQQNPIFKTTQSLVVLPEELVNYRFTVLEGGQSGSYLSLTRASSGPWGVSCILPLRKATVIWPKYSFLFRFISTCLSNPQPWAGQCSRQSQVNAALSLFLICLFPAFQGFPY